MATHTILDQFKQAAYNNRDLVDKIERLIANYLVKAPLYQDKYSDVWLWNEWPDRGNQPDTGIDLVVKEHGSDYVAVQCKFYDPAHSLQKSDIDSFFSTSDTSFPTLEGEKNFASRLIVSATDKWSKHAETGLENQKIPVNRLRVQDLSGSLLDLSQFSLNRQQDIKLKPKKALRSHQKSALEKVENSFQTANSGKPIMACGTGKTFTTLKIAEQLTPGKGTVLFFVPSISRLSQTLREWTAETERPFHSFAVCKDSKVGKKSDNKDLRAL
ncbi:MAG: DEAD/DEAH box helicase family protein [Methylococcaceae bacterium]|nr:DEAD/DEAH box helicase family protein [Methylococcaceae bacterium]